MGDVGIEQFRSEARRWIGERQSADPDLFVQPVASLEDAWPHHRALQRALFDAGLSRRGWPEGAGGLGGSTTLRAVLYDELWATGYVPEGFQTLEIIGPMLCRYAGEIASQHLAAFIAGDEVWCQGFSEPNAGSDMAAIRARAVPDGDGWRLSGQKIWTSLVSVATHCLVLARTGTIEERHRGLSMFVVPLASPGIEARPIEAISGRNEFGEVFFDDVAVPREALIGDIGAGWALAMYLLQWERGGYAWLRQGLVHRRVSAALSARGGLAHPALARAWSAAGVLRCRSMSTLRALAEGVDLGPAISVDKLLLSRTEQFAYDVLREMAAGDFELDAGDAAEQLREEWFYTRAASIYGGTAEIQRTIVADRLLGLPKEPVARG